MDGGTLREQRHVEHVGGGFQLILKIVVGEGGGRGAGRWRGSRGTQFE
jgi:hypothetical protein